jgi:hypothetical protein
MKRRDCFPGGKQSAQSAGRWQELSCQGADHAKKAKEKDDDADAINHPKMDVFAWIDGHKRAQKPAFSFHMNYRFGHAKIESTSHATVIVRA